MVSHLRAGLAASVAGALLTSADSALTTAPVSAPALNTDRSQELFNAALKLMPGGVSSPVRAFRSVGGQPIVFDRVKGAYAWDVDGNRYIDYIGSWGRRSAATPIPR